MWLLVATGSITFKATIIGINQGHLSLGVVEGVKLCWILCLSLIGR